MNNRVLISHESPLCLLEESKKYNDYDYCLVHLLDKYPQYLEFFLQSKKEGRKILLDNSIFELKESFKHEEFAEWVERLKPDEYVVPDVLNDSEGTIRHFEKWERDHSSITHGKKIGVVHGKNYQEIVDCYLFMEKNADKIAISFDNPFFKTIGHIHPTYKMRATSNDYGWFLLMSGRMEIVAKLYMDGYWNSKKPHHLLGCSLPQEFGSYNYELLNIESIDTSNPIVMGLHDILYDDIDGVYSKKTTLLADLIESQITEKQKSNILFNISKFNEIIDFSYSQHHKMEAKCND